MHMPYIYRYTLLFLAQPNLARNWLKLGIAANKTSAKQFKFEFKLAAPLAGCLCCLLLLPHLLYATAPKSSSPLPPVTSPCCPAAWPLLMPSNDIEGPITRCDAVCCCCCCCGSFFFISLPRVECQPTVFCAPTALPPPPPPPC